MSHAQTRDIAVWELAPKHSNIEADVYGERREVWNGGDI